MSAADHAGDPRLGPDYAVAPDGVVYYLKARSLDYGPDYFLEEYRNQYGRTYLEDEEIMRAGARRRLGLLDEFAPELRDASAPGDLLEVGCAVGFFLDEARKRGWRVEGLDVSEYAVRHATDKLGLKARAESFLDYESETKFDVVAAFYVIEHFADQERVWNKIASLLKPGGFFLFALPSTHGPLFRYDPGRWVETHPADHFADYSPGSLKAVLPRHGMELLKAGPATFHPNRMKSFFPWHRFPRLYQAMAQWRSFGDTMEGIARRS